MIIPAFRAAEKLPRALASLEKQEGAFAFEVIVVNSGGQPFAYEPREGTFELRLLDFKERLWPGRARNQGLGAARGPIIAFMPADAIGVPGWLASRLAAHAAGADLVGGSILNGTPRHPIGTAEYLLEYSALMPSRDLLAEQQIPHAVSFKRAVLDRVGPYPEESTTGEDTIFSRSCVEAGLRVTYEPRAALLHEGSRSLIALLAHAHAHGRGLAQCIRSFGLESAIGPAGQPLGQAALRALVSYPAQGMMAKTRRLTRFAPRRLPAFLLLAPLIALGLLATGTGALYEQLIDRHRKRPRDHLTSPP